MVCVWCDVFDAVWCVCDVTVMYVMWGIRCVRDTVCVTQYGVCVCDVTDVCDVTY